MDIEASMSDSETDKKYLTSLGDGGLTPTASELAAAPFLDRWRIDEFMLVGHRVVGNVTGHPILDDGIINTSSPVAADLDAGWMHTRNTLYRLGAHKGDRDE
jgi:hypothetical protein